MEINKIIEVVNYKLTNNYIITKIFLIIKGNLAMRMRI